VRNASDELESETFVVISGDALTDIDLGKLVAYHATFGAMATICLKSVPNRSSFGIVVTREDGTSSGSSRSPTGSGVQRHDQHRRLRAWSRTSSSTSRDTVFELPQDLFPLMLDKGMPMYGYVADGYWCDVGHFESYLKAHRDVLDGLVDVDIPRVPASARVWWWGGADGRLAQREARRAVVSDTTPRRSRRLGIDLAPPHPHTLAEPEPGDVDVDEAVEHVAGAP